MLKSHEVAYMLSNGVGIYRCGTALINSKDGDVSIIFDEDIALTCMTDDVRSRMWRSQ